MSGALRSCWKFESFGWKLFIKQFFGRREEEFIWVAQLSRTVDLILRHVGGVLRTTSNLHKIHYISTWAPALFSRISQLGQFRLFIVEWMDPKLRVVNSFVTATMYRKNVSLFSMTAEFMLLVKWCFVSSLASQLIWLNRERCKLIEM